MFISTDTILQAFDELKNIEDLKNESILFSFFIIKGCGYDNFSFKSIDLLKEKSKDYCANLSFLFSPIETSTLKNNFFNPFAFSKNWKSQPSESIEKWAPGRLKNNILGGAITWRDIIEIEQSTNDIKFFYDYFEQILKLTNSEKKINLPALAIWENRFNEFEKEVTISKICDNFLEKYNIELNEKLRLFNFKTPCKLSFLEDIFDAEVLREKIGNPISDATWSTSIPNVSPISYETFKIVQGYSSLGGIKMPITTEEKVQKLLNKYQQIILYGPPATSKSFYCEKIKSDYTETLKIQFHPQYTYQEFIGGYFVEGDKVIYKPGVLVDFIELAEKSPENNFLLIIDEINRANVSQVFGELISCLDREYSIKIKTAEGTKDFQLPKNLSILATMNSTDRTLGKLDYALSRRFLKIYCPPAPQILDDLCSSDDFISLTDFLEKINKSLLEITKDREMVLGHALFLEEAIKNESGTFDWNFEEFEILFNYKVLPLIEDLCLHDEESIQFVVGSNLCNRLTDEDFSTALKGYVLE